MQNELGVQLQKLANQGYILLNIVHAEDKTDFKTQQHYIGTSLSNALYGVAEKFVDQIIYLRRDEVQGKIKHTIWFNSKGGFSGAGGRWSPAVDSIECSYANLEKVMLETISNSATAQGAKIEEVKAPSVTIQQDNYDFVELKNQFQNIVDGLMANKNEDTADKIKSCVETVLGSGKKVGDLGPTQGELLAEIITSLKQEFKEG